MNDPTDFFSTMIQLGGLLVTATWAVSAIKSTTVQLTSTIKSLETTVEKLARTIETIEKKAVDHEVRIRTLESDRKTNNRYDINGRDSLGS